MRLDYLFDAEVRFKEFFYPRGPGGSDPHVYCLGEGLIGGERLRGTMRWTNRARRRDDGKTVELGKVIQNTGTWLPHFDGVIRTGEGVEVLFSFAGYNVSTGIEGDRHHRSITARITFSSRDDRYIWLNNVYGLLVGKGSWPADEDNALSVRQTGRYKDDEVWQLSGFALVNEMGHLAEAGMSSNLPIQESNKKETNTPQLRQLFVSNLLFGESIRFPASGEDSDWVGYSAGGGAIESEGFKGEINCTVTSRRQLNGAWLPHLSGKIHTIDGAIVLLTFRGYHLPISAGSESGYQEITGSITFQTKDAKFRRLNNVLGLLEGDTQIRDGELWRIRTFECVNPSENKM